LAIEGGFTLRFLQPRKRSQNLFFKRQLGAGGNEKRFIDWSANVQLNVQLDMFAVPVFSMLVASVKRGAK
jgi:hypothetical protein